MIDLTGVNILVVDDEPPIRKMVSRKLENSGAKCYTAASVDEAVTLLSKYPVNVLITDYNMPLKTGVELLEHVKQHLPHITRIVITGYSNDTIVNNILSTGVYGYLLKPIDHDALLITIENAMRIHQYERKLNSQQEIIESKLERRNNRLEAIMSNIHLGVMLVSPKLQIIEVNKKMKEWFPDVEKGLYCFQTVQPSESKEACAGCRVVECLANGKKFETNKDLVTQNGIRDYHITISPIVDNESNISASLIIYDDITEKLLAERSLQQAQKLESVGQLAAGIAHEINTPTQYISDNIRFLQDATNDLKEVISCFQNQFNLLEEQKSLPQEIKEKIEHVIEDTDLEYLNEELPITFSQTTEGINRVKEIVRAMKEFSHPGEKEKALADINNIIKNTSTVCKNEWKYVAQLELELDKNLPLINCYSNELSQVILNMIVNAAHGISEKKEDVSSKLGTITISTIQDNDSVTITITDNGIGMATEVQEKMFDPFYTTKERGKGTGQGLAISKRIVIDEHNGQLSCTSEINIGTQFTITLPLT